MRNLDGTLEFRPSLIGSLSVTGATAVGAPIDTIGFADVLATLISSAVVGSNALSLAVKFQESASATGTGANWTDIANGDYSGTFAFDTISYTGTDPALSKGIAYERLMSYRSRYIRAHATVTGTSGLGIRFSVGCLLGRPVDTLYVTNASSMGTGNVEYSRAI